MIRRNILAIIISALFLSSSIFADNNHGTHVAGTIGAVGNNGSSIGSQGRDVLVGGTGADRSTSVPTGTITFFDSGVVVVAFAVQAMMTAR